MASSEKPEAAESGKDAPPPAAATYDRRVNYFAVDVALRLLLLAAAVTSVAVTVTGDQTVIGKLRGVPPGLPVQAKFHHSPAFIYFVAALSVAGLYSLITAIASISVIAKPNLSPKFLLYFAFFDALILGVVASATGSAGGVGYIGLKGNSHVQWNKVCYAFDKFCRHIAGALGASLFASVILVLLIWLSLFSLHSRIRT